MDQENNTQPKQQQEAQTSNNGLKTKLANNKATILAVSVALLFVGGAAAFSSGIFGDSSGGEAVARVNGEEIQRSALENQVAQLKSQQGAQQAPENQLRQSALDQLISQRLLVQEARQSGATANDEDVNAQLDELKAGFENDTQFQQQLEQANLTEKDLRQSISEQLLIQQYIDKEIPESQTAATEEEINNLYEQYSAQSKEVPALEDMREQIKNQIENQKLDEFLATLVEELRTQSEIEILI